MLISENGCSHLLSHGLSAFLLLRAVKVRGEKKVTMDTKVLIAGGGPVGLSLAMLLQHFGVECIMLERNETTTRHPKMDITNGRSMEIFRKLGVNELIREKAVSADNDYGVIWCTNLSGWELERFDYPSTNQVWDRLKEENDGKYALEPCARISQIVLEPIFKDKLENNCHLVDVRFGWKLVSFQQDEDGVTSTIKSTKTGEVKTIRSQYLAGCDGAGSVVRNGLGINLHEISPLNPDAAIVMAEGEKIPPRRRYMIHFKSPEIGLLERFGRAWHLQSPHGWVLIAQDDADTWTIHIPVLPDEDPETFDPKRKLFDCLGCEFECDIKVANAWTPRLSIAESYGKGRVWLAGDSAHQVVPTGGYGMNTGIGDALALGWAFAAIVQGWGGTKLLQAYETERRHVGIRNRLASERHVKIRADIRNVLTEDIHNDSSDGEQSRQKLGQYIKELGNLENEAWGIEWGYRYDESPVICHESDGEAPPYKWEEYTPSTWPGVRPPNLFLKDGVPLFDHFGKFFTLLTFAEAPTLAIEDAATAIGLPLDIVAIKDEKAADLYEKKLVLLRPDHHVAWRGDTLPDEAGIHKIIDTIRGH